MTMPTLTNRSDDIRRDDGKMMPRLYTLYLLLCLPMLRLRLLEALVLCIYSMCCDIWSVARLPASHTGIH